MSATRDDIYFYDGLDGELRREVVMGERFIRWGYQNAELGRLRRFVYGRSLLSRVMGAYYNSRLSRRGIRKAIANLEIDPSEFRDPVESYRCFNHFFYRHLNLDECRPHDPDPRVVVSPADGRVLVYPELDGHRAIPLKGRHICAHELLGEDAGAFEGGAMAVIRLCPADYHRFHYPCEGRIVAEHAIAGLYHSVNPLALWKDHNVFGENKRSYSILKSPQLGRFVYMEVGAFGVGSILRSHQSPSFSKMEERGYFEFGGSTVILLFQKGRIEFVPQLVAHSAEGYETLMRVGETIGYTRSERNS
ncbi:MAG: archaetidylserine decarboxylase [Planctomycetota bacterium]